MKTVNYSDKAEIKKIIDRQGADLEGAFDPVRRIIRDVRERGDAALIDYTKKFDGFDLSTGNIRVSKQEIKKAYENISPELLKAIEHSGRNIRKFHSGQMDSLRKSWKIEIEKGVDIEEKTAPIESAGVYVPGGRASYPSTVLMACIPARTAGVKRIVVASPPPISDAVIVACDQCKVDEIYRMGGAQAVAALAYGTESVERTDKIVGPGNKYVMAAKLLVFGKVGIDMPAGPSEILIIADSRTDPKYVAADLLAQAEHDPDAQCVLATDSKSLTEKVETEIRKQINTLKRKELISKSLDHSYAVIVRNMDEAAEFANLYAPEHLEMLAVDAKGIAEKITQAGTIFVGSFAPVPAGDYASGENHVLPTGGSARFSSSLGVRDFMRNYSIQNISAEGLSNLRKTIETLAKAESLDAHAKCVRIRFT